MSVSQDDIRWAYQTFLARPPESEAAVSNLIDVTDFRALCEIFAKSQEFMSKITSPPIGRYFGASSFDTEIDCSPADLSRMIHGVVENWRRFGDVDPHWSVLTGEQFRAGNIAANVDDFYGSGVGDVNSLLAPLERSGHASNGFINALDFGCGVGRLSLALADRVTEVTGVDISLGHIKVARARALETKKSNATFELIESIDQLDRYRNFDLIISLIVLQHNPPPVMAVLLQKLLRALRIGGVAVIQIPTYLEGVSFSVAGYLNETQPEMEMNAMPQHIIYKIIHEEGCLPIEVREDNSIGPIGLSHRFAIERLK